MGLHLSFIQEKVILLLQNFFCPVTAGISRLGSLNSSGLGKQAKRCSAGLLLVLYVVYQESYCK